MANHNQKGIGRIWHATLYSLAGIRAAWTHEAAFRQEVLLTMILAPAAFWLGGSTVERLLLLGSCLARRPRPGCRPWPGGGPRRAWPP